MKNSSEKNGEKNESRPFNCISDDYIFILSILYLKWKNKYLTCYLCCIYGSSMPWQMYGISRSLSHLGNRSFIFLTVCFLRPHTTYLSSLSFAVCHNFSFSHPVSFSQGAHYALYRRSVFRKIVCINHELL